MPLITEERRRHRRYQIDNAVTTTHEGIYQIFDISMGGFSFRCAPYAKLPDTWLADILNPLEQLLGYHAIRVWISMPAFSSSEFLPIVMGAKFGTLTKEQRNLLSRVIKAISENNTPEQ
jgi:hypothetical protein